MRFRLSVLLACVMATSALPGGAWAGPEDAFTPPVVPGLVLDGSPDEVAWQSAARLPFDPVQVPRPVEEGGPGAITPEVRVALSGGRLCLAVRMPEAAGTAMGLHLMVAPEGAASAADAVSLDFRPLELRAPRYRVIGPKGVGRSHYRMQGAVAWSAGTVAHRGGEVHVTPGVWTLEAGLPVTDLVGAAVDQVLRLAVVVTTRTPNVLAAWPAGAIWKQPAAWAALRPPEGGWPLAVEVDAEALAAEDAADLERQAAWLQYLRGASTPLLPLERRADLLAAIRSRLLEPLDAVVAHRPDLLVPVLCVQGDIHHRLGLSATAAALYERALTEGGLGWRDAAYGLYVKVGGPAFAEGDVGGPTDFTQARSRIDMRGRMLPPPHGLEDEGLRLGRALLDHKEGRFDDALPVLESLSKRYPFDAFLEAHMRMAHRGRRAAGEEKLLVKRDATASLPRAVVETTRGAFTIELFQRDVGNAVNNFVWLAKNAFYDGVAIHHTVPFFALQTGDPHSKAGAAHPELLGTGGPGYAIPTEVGPRRPLRGYVAFANAGRDTDGSQFLVFTGTAVHLQGEVTVFGRIVAGMTVVDALRAGDEADRILAVKVDGLEPGRTYRPTDLSGAPAPKPTVPE